MSTKTSSDLSSYGVVNIADFNPKGNITFTKPKPNKIAEGSSGSAKYHGKYFSLATAKIQTPFGCSKYVNKEDANKPNATNSDKTPKFSISFPLANKNTERQTPEIKQLYEKMSEFDEAVMEYLSKEDPVTDIFVGKNPKTGIRHDRGGFEPRYTGAIRFPKEPLAKDGTPYDCMFATSVVLSGDYATQFYNKDRKPLTVHFNTPSEDCDKTSPEYLNYVSNVIPKGSHCILIVAPMVYISGNNFGVKWQIRQCVVYPPVFVIPTSCIIPLSEEEVNQTEDPVDPSMSQLTLDPVDPSMDVTNYES
jgi:hypothetical protein